MAVVIAKASSYVRTHMTAIFQNFGLIDASGLGTIRMDPDPSWINKQFPTIDDYINRKMKTFKTFPHLYSLQAFSDSAVTIT